MVQKSNFEIVHNLKIDSQRQQEKIVSRIENGESFPQYKSDLCENFGCKNKSIKIPEIYKK